MRQGIISQIKKNSRYTLKITNKSAIDEIIINSIVYLI